MTYGYDAGQPFGDPNKFTRSTGEDEIDRYNQWMRSQPWWQQARGTGQGNFSDDQRKQLEATMASQGINLPKEFHVDEGGNINQKSRVKSRIVKGAIAAGLGLTGVGLAGMGPLAGLGGAIGGGSGAAATTGGIAGTSATGGAAAGLLPASGFIGGVGATVPTVAGTSLTGAAATGGGIMGSLGGLKGIGQLAGAGLSGIAKAGAGDRSDAANAGYMTDEMNLQRSQEDRAARDAAWKDMMHAEYVKNYKPSDTGFSTYSRPIQGPSDTARQGAGGLSAEAMKRLMDGSQLPAMTDYNKLAKPGALERIGRYASPILGAFGGRR